MDLEQTAQTGQTAVLVIDAQVNMFDPDHPVHGADALLSRLQNLVAQARAAHVPLLFVRNCGSAEYGDADVRGTRGWELHPALMIAPGDPVLDKTTCDTFASTTLEDELKARGITHLVIAGLQSEYCIQQTTAAARERGYAVTLVSDGHSTYASETRTAPEISAAVNAAFADRVTRVPADQLRFG